MVSNTADPEVEKDSSIPTLPGSALALLSDRPDADEDPDADAAKVVDEIPFPTLFGVGR